MARGVLRGVRCQCRCAVRSVTTLRYGSHECRWIVARPGPPRIRKPRCDSSEVVETAKVKCTAPFAEAMKISFHERRCMLKYPPRVPRQQLTTSWQCTIPRQGDCVALGGGFTEAQSVPRRCCQGRQNNHRSASGKTSPESQKTWRMTPRKANME